MACPVNKRDFSYARSVHRRWLQDRANAEAMETATTSRRI
jgi:hypothetical protein